MKYTDDVDEYGTYVVMSKSMQKRELRKFKRMVEKLNAATAAKEIVATCDFCGQVMQHNDTVTLNHRVYHKVCADAVIVRVYRGLKELGVFDDSTG